MPANGTDMEAIQHYFKTIELGNPQVTIDLPEGVDQAEVEVIVRPLHGVHIEDGKPQRYNIAQRMKGTMSSDYDANQFDVYDQ